MKIAIIYQRLFERDGSRLTVGGIQTYLAHLADICVDLGWETLVLQSAEREFKRQFGNATVWGIPGGPTSGDASRLGSFLLAEAEKWAGSDDLISIFGTNTLSIPSRNRKRIAIQHGVAWDLPLGAGNDRDLDSDEFRQQNLPAGLMVGARARLQAPLHKARCRLVSLAKARLEAQRFERCDYQVCVDYNFYNWYKTVTRERLRSQVWVIPNFTDIASDQEIAAREDGTEKLSILFARRFYWYRGTRIMASAVRELLRIHPSLNVTFAGEGPDEERLKSEFRNENRVHFTLYAYRDAKELLLKHHIAVIPSIGSEGTSLSVAEAMGAGCAVVATCVGGITNMVIDGYNGCLVMPDAVSLYNGLDRIIRDRTLRNNVGLKGRETAASAFSLGAWQVKWKQVLHTVAEAS